MAQFKATVKRADGRAKTLLDNDGEMVSTVSGDDCGVRVYAYRENGQDKFQVILTNGSNGAGSSTRIGTFTAKHLNSPDKGLEALAGEVVNNG